MEKVLSQAETVSAGGIDWSYRMGVPEDGVEVDNKVVFVHGAGLVGFTYSKLMREMQLGGYVCRPDMPGHGKTFKPAPSNFNDATSYRGAGRVHLRARPRRRGPSTSSSPVYLRVGHRRGSTFPQ